jgi:hypothetical protein
MDLLVWIAAIISAFSVVSLGTLALIWFWCDDDAHILWRLGFTVLGVHSMILWCIIAVMTAAEVTR